MKAGLFTFFVYTLSTLALAEPTVRQFNPVIPTSQPGAPTTGPHAAPPNITFTAPPSTPQLPRRPGSNFELIRRGVRVTCPQENGNGFTKMDIAENGFSADFVQWGCRASNAGAEEDQKSPLSFCGVETNYHNLHQGHFLYQSKKSLFYCTMSSAPQAQDYDIVFQSQLGENSSMYCRANENVRELFVAGKQGYFAFQSEREKDSLAAAMQRQGMDGWLTCDRNRATGDLRYAGALNLKADDWLFSCAGDNNLFTARCDGALGNCTFAGGMNRDRTRGVDSWFARGGLGDAGFLECSGNRGRLEALAASITVPLPRLRSQGQVTTNFSAENGFGAGLRLIAPRGSGYFNFTAPHGQSRPSGPAYEMLNFGLQLDY